jgi:hypothetical protein
MCCLLWRIYEMHPSLSLKSGCDIDQFKFRESKTFSSLCSLQNLFSSKGLVKISTSWWSVLVWQTSIPPFCWWSLRKWCQMSMCLVRLCSMRLSAKQIALSLSHRRLSLSLRTNGHIANIFGRKWAKREFWLISKANLEHLEGWIDHLQK